MVSNIKIVPVQGKDVASYIDHLASLRMQIFREYPYLYDGSLSYEEKYLKSYTENDSAVVFLAMDGTNVVGASTALPLACEERAFYEPLLQVGFDIPEIMYFGESVLLPEYRGQGIGWRFFDEREAYARAMDGVEYCCFCTVERPVDHALRPTSYRSPEGLWHKRGYLRQPIYTRFSWKDIDQPEETSKPMVYWMRALTRRDVCNRPKTT